MAATTQAPRTRQYAVRGVTNTGAMAPAPSSSDDEGTAFFSRWLKVWIALLTVVTLVVVVYLVAITNSLADINGNLGVADEAVSGAGGDTVTLPQQVASINESLGAIDPALQPIPGQADAIIGALTSIDGRLAETDGSLIDTSASLQATSGQLVDTSGILQSVLGQAGDIRNTLALADRPNGDCAGTGTPGQAAAGAACGADQLGVQNIHQRVAIANSVLVPVDNDTTSIVAGLDVVNANLLGICNNAAVALLGGLSGAGSCNA